MASWIVYLRFAERAMSGAMAELHPIIGIAICAIRPEILPIFIPCERKEELG